MRDVFNRYDVRVMRTNTDLNPVSCVLAEGRASDCCGFVHLGRCVYDEHTSTASCNKQRKNSQCLVLREHRVAVVVPHIHKNLNNAPSVRGAREVG